MKHLLAFLFSLAWTSLLLADATAPASSFRDLTVAEAVAKGLEEKKPVLLFFDGYWSDDAQSARREIFDNAELRDGIRAHAYAVRIDVLTSPALTAQHKIIHAPTLIWLNSVGLPVLRSHCEDPAEIGRDIEKRIIRIGEIRATLRPEDHQGRLRLCQAYKKADEDQLALLELRALYTDAVARPPGELPPTATRVELADIFSQFDYLSRSHWPVTEAIREMIPQEEALIRANPNDADAARRFCELIKITFDMERAQALHDSLPAGAAREILALRSTDHQSRLKSCRALLRKKRYAQALTELHTLYIDASALPAGKLSPKVKRVTMAEIMTVFIDLSRVHWPTTEVAREILAREAALMNANPNNADAARRFCELASISGDLDRIRSLHDQLPAGRAREILSTHLPK